MPVGDRKDPYRSYGFLVEIDGITRAGFRECSGLDSSQDPVDYREGNEPHTARKLPGLVKHSNISLKWGVTDDAQLWRSEEHTSELQSPCNLVCRLLLEKKKK